MKDFDNVIAIVVDTLVENYNAKTNYLNKKARCKILNTIIRNNYDFDEVFDRASYYIENFEQLSFVIECMRQFYEKATLSNNRVARSLS